LRKGERRGDARKDRLFAIRAAERVGAILRVEAFRGRRVFDVVVVSSWSADLVGAHLPHFYFLLLLYR